MTHDKIARHLTQAPHSFRYYEKESLREVAMLFAAEVRRLQAENERLLVLSSAAIRAVLEGEGP